MGDGRVAAAVVGSGIPGCTGLRFSELACGTPEMGEGSEGDHAGRAWRLSNVLQRTAARPP